MRREESALKQESRFNELYEAKHGPERNVEGVEKKKNEKKRRRERTYDERGRSSRLARVKQRVADLLRGYTRLKNNPIMPDQVESEFFNGCKIVSINRITTERWFQAVWEVACGNRK